VAIELTFALAPRQNRFFAELVAALRFELSELGVRSEVGTGPLPAPRRGRVTVLVPPHEWFALTPEPLRPHPGELRRAVFICAEQPGTWFFDEDVRLAGAHGAAVLDINASSVRELRRRGVAADHLPIGWTRHWACAPEELDGARDLDLLHLGLWSERRAAALARYAPHLARWRSRLILADPEGPHAEPAPNFVVEDDKWALLRRSRALLNVHVDERPYFEWLRVAQAIANGVAVVTEHSTGVAPLEAGRHFVSGSVDALGLLAGGLLENEDRRRAMARDAYELLRAEMPLRRSAELLVAAAESVADREVRIAPRPPRPPVPAGPVATPRVQFPSSITDPQTSQLRATLKDIRLELLEDRRVLEELRRGPQAPAVERVAESAGYAAATPLVSVAIPVYNDHAPVGAALDSCAGQTFGDLEVVVVDDGSTDASSEEVQAWFAAHPGVPGVLVRHGVNRGLGAARNTAVDFARGQLVCLLDADNRLYPPALERLEAALADQPDAAFAYPMLAIVENDAPVGLKSCFPLTPSRFATGNYIDALALWRASALRDLGGYTTDVRLHGWEDYDLYCRATERGRRGILVPEILAQYTLRRHSILSITDLSTRNAVSLLIERYPTVMAGVEPPL